MASIPAETEAFFRGDSLRIRVFLDKYALKGEQGELLERVPPEMWRRIAREIASVEPDREGWEERFYWLLEDFRFIPGGRIMFGAGQPRRATLFNCFPSGTRVLTKEGFKPIERIAPGEEVLTHKDRFRRVICSISREVEEPLRIVKLWYLGDQPLIATGDHRFLCFDGRKVDWIMAKDLTPQHYVKVGRIKETLLLPEIDIADYVGSEVLEDEEEQLYTATSFVGGNGAIGVRESKRLSRKIPLDERFGLWLGYFMAEGGVTAHSVYFTFSKDEETEAETVAALTQELFGIEALIQRRRHQEGHWLRVNVHSNLLAEFIKGFFQGATHGHERRLPSWFLLAPQRVQKAFISGLFLGDGVIKDDSIGLFLANPELVRQVYLILLRLGVVASLRWEGILRYTRHRGMWIHLGIQRYVEAVKAWMEGDWEYEVGLEEVPFNYFYKVVNGDLFLKVKSVGWTRPRRERVYDLSVEEDSSFVAEFAVAHNCYVIPIREDSIEGIFDWCREAARTYSYGGGAGVDISILRPRGTPVNNAAIYSSGAVSFMDLLSTTTGTIGQAGRRGALMITMRVDHPDILDFLGVKRDPSKVTSANISVRVSDAFMEAVERDGDFTLWYESEAVPRVERRVRARELWGKLIQAAWESAEPGVIFWDTVKRESTTEYGGMEVFTTNPCSEITLEPYGCCDLGSINLSAFVKDEFTPQAHVDWEGLERALRYGVRFLDDVLDYGADRHPLPQQREASLRSRRIGLGFTGLGDFLIKLGMKYDTEEAIGFVDRLFERIKHITYEESVALAREKGPFPAFDPKRHFQSPFIQRLDPALQKELKEHGLRNAALLTVPPVGSGSALAGVSSGIEPLFSLSYVRRSESLGQEEFHVLHPLVRAYLERKGLKEDELSALPPEFVTAHQIAPEMRIKMQAAIQKHIDHAISSTVNLPKEATPQDVERIYLEAWRQGCKGVTVYREGSRRGIMLTEREAEAARAQEQEREEEPLRQQARLPRSRPKVVKGKTYNFKTEMGSLFVTVNEDEHGPFEVFVQLGKSGSASMAFTEAIGRLISLALRSGIKPSAIIDQLQLIRGSRLIIQEDGQVVFSVPDAIAKALAEYLKGGEQLKLIENHGPPPLKLLPTTKEPKEDGKKELDLCPMCGGVLLFTGGCYLCQDCGYTRCD
ncbi:MAG: adenosylcobalamin-dependent ribonucleoside-diphosphate reductase [Candidatus Bipolaricaulia bacterium]